MAGSLALGSSASGVGNLTIQNGASLTTFSGTGFTGAGISIGNGTPSTAPATLTVNSGSTVNTGGVTVGDTQPGALTINNATVITSGSAIIGSGIIGNGVGTVIVTGPNASWTVGGVINLGLGLNALNACPVILCHRLPSETVTLCSPRPS